MTEPHDHRPSYWNHLFHHDKSDLRNRSGKHTLVCKHCGKPICKKRRTLPWWLLIVLVVSYLMILANEDFLREHLGLLVIPVALMFLADYYELRTNTYMLLEEYEAMQEDTENTEEEG